MSLLEEVLCLVYKIVYNKFVLFGLWSVFVEQYHHKVILLLWIESDQRCYLGAVFQGDDCNVLSKRSIQTALCWETFETLFFQASSLIWLHFSSHTGRIAAVRGAREKSEGAFFVLVLSLTHFWTQYLWGFFGDHSIRGFLFCLFLLLECDYGQMPVGL